MGSTAARRIAAVLTAVATALVVVAVSIVPFLTPQWFSFEQGRAQATLWTGFTSTELDAATGAILADLVFGPPDFDVEVRGEPVLNARERSHMRDVRGAFAGFVTVVLVAAAGLVAMYAGARRLGHPQRWWSAVRAGALSLVVVIPVAGVVAFFAFDAAFEVFHRLFFAGGTYLFDPATDRLVQLFPFAFWSETTLVLGAVIIALSVAVAFVAGRRARRVRSASADPEIASAPAPAGRPGSEPAA